MESNESLFSEKDIEAQIKLFQQNPSEYNKILKTLIQKASKINYILFAKNIQSIASKITSITKEAYYDMYQGFSCIYGAFLGDAMGSHCEFTQYNLENYKSIFNGNNVFDYSPGQITDDSEMALSMVFSIMDNPKPKELNQSLLYFYYGLWRSSSPRDIGNTTSAALRNFNLDTTDITREAFSQVSKLTKIINSSSLSNGYLMRISPFVVWYYYCNKSLIKETLNNSKEFNRNLYSELYKSIKDTVTKDNQITHWNSEVYSSSAVFVFMSLCSMCGYSSKEILIKLKYLIMLDIFNKNSDKSMKNHIESTLDLFSQSDFNKEDYMKVISTKHIGWYLHAFNLTLYYLYFFDRIKHGQTSKYRQIINEICNWGGDTDTNAAIVGTVIGPLIGFTNFGNEDLTIFLTHYCKDRYGYSSAFIYFFMQYLESQSFNEITQEYKFNFIKYLLLMLNTEMKL